MIRFLHSSDLHLGKRFGNFHGDLPSRLRDARHGVIGKLGQHARAHGATTILLAGDTFDTETPAPEVRRQAFAEMRRHAPIRWVILPGNHDSLQATQLWTTLAGEAPENVVLALEPRPIPLGDGAMLLPAPCTTRRPGRDLSEWMDTAATPDGSVRIGLAHGPVQSFSEGDVSSDVIAPDRARRAGLGYLALGDWHGPVAVDARTHYSGSPEPDRFKHDRPGRALLVTFAQPAAPPEIAPLDTASFEWRQYDLHLLVDDDPVPKLEALLPTDVQRRQTLARVTAAGRSRLAAHAALTRAIERAKPEFAFLALHADGLATECEVDDLDGIDRAGALRDAADALHAEFRDEGRSADERDIARAALARLYSYSQADAAS